MLDFLFHRKCRSAGFVAAMLVLFLALPVRGARVFDTVVVDAGHGGWDRGGLRHVKLPEKKLTLDTAQILRDKLEEAGLRVVMTRETDVYIPLSHRVEIGNKHSNSIFVSVHYNATYGSSAHGIETYCARRTSKSIPLRDAIHRQLIRRTGARNRYTRTAGFYVLRHTKSAAVLVEGGFLSNSRESKKLASSEYRELIADCIAEGILDFRDQLNGSAMPRNRRKSSSVKPESETPEESSREADEDDDDVMPSATSKSAR